MINPIRIAGSILRSWEFTEGKFADYKKLGIKSLDAVVASTSPARWMDLSRADAAIEAVKEIYGDMRFYSGLWIAAGTLGGEPYEESQRKGIVDRWSEKGVPKNRIIQIDGKDTIDKTRELLKIPELGDDRYGPVRLGISSYPLHVARFDLAFRYALKEGYKHDLMIIGIPTDYSQRPKSDDKARPLNDNLFGWLGLVKDAIRLERYGFSDSVPGQSSSLHKKLKELNSEDGEKVR